MNNGHLKNIPQLPEKSDNMPFPLLPSFDFTEPKLLEEALQFKGTKYKPVDFIETNYENNGNGRR